MMANSRRTIYIGMTNDLVHRVQEHRNGSIAGYSSRYKLTKLVWHQEFATAIEAIVREKQIKGWLRVRKIALVEETNPLWHDLVAGWFDSLKENAQPSS